MSKVVPRSCTFSNLSSYTIFCTTSKILTAAETPEKWGLKTVNAKCWACVCAGCSGSDMVYKTWNMWWPSSKTLWNLLVNHTKLVYEIDYWEGQTTFARDCAMRKLFGGRGSGIPHNELLLAWQRYIHTGFAWFSKLKIKKLEETYHWIFGIEASALVQSWRLVLDFRSGKWTIDDIKGKCVARSITQVGMWIVHDCNTLSLEVRYFFVFKKRRIKIPKTMDGIQNRSLSICRASLK